MCPISQSTQAVQPTTIGFVFLLETSLFTIITFSQPFMNTAWEQATIETRRLHGYSLLHTKTMGYWGRLGGLQSLGNIVFLLFCVT